MDNFKITPQFKQNFLEFFWWAAPLSVIADLIAIWGLFSFKQQAISNQPVSAPEISHVKVFGVVSISDAIVLTGFFTLFIVVSIVYFSITKTTSDNFWPSIIGAFISLLLVWSYFRLWLGEHGWLWILLAAILVCIVATITVFNTTTIPGTIRVGCIVTTATLTILTVFLLITTGALGRVTNTWQSYESPSFVVTNTPLPLPSNAFTVEIPTLDSTYVNTPTLIAANAVNIVFPAVLQPVHFEPGATSYEVLASVEAATPQGYKLYILGGQRLKVYIKAGNVTVEIWDSYNARMTPSAKESGYTEVLIPQRGYYVIGIYGDSKFDMMIEIPPL